MKIYIHSKDVDLKKVSNKEDNTNNVKGQKSRIKETKKSIFIFGAEARKSVMEEKKSEKIEKS